MSEEHVLHCRREGGLAIRCSLPIAITGDILFGRTQYHEYRSTWPMEPDTVQYVAVDTENLKLRTEGIRVRRLLR